MKIITLISTSLILLLKYSYEGTKKEVIDLFDGQYDYPVYSGYLNTLVDGNELFYIYFPSQNNPETVPVLLWLNGGPGCSSLFGFISEIGPVVNDNFGGKFIKNEYSWNKNLNLLFIEQPAGVGFSPTSDPSFNWTETITAQNLYYAIKDFYNVFTDLKDRAFYVSGESYAGVYIPYLTNEILNDASENRINFQGFMIGNAYTDFIHDDRSMIDFAFYRGLLSIELYNSYQKNCPHLLDELNPETADYGIGDMENWMVTHKCNEINNQISKYLTGSDIYGIYRLCPNESYLNKNENDLLSENKKHTIKYTTFKKMRSFHNKKNYHVIDDTHEKFEPEDDFWPELCSEDLLPDQFLNSNKTKEKLGVKNMSTIWSQCVDLNYFGEESVNFYNTTMLKFPQYKYWLFSGTEDGCVPTLGTMRWINKFNFEVEKEWANWKADNNQISGYDQKYKEGLVLVTIKGAGHMVPQDKRAEAKFLIDSFVEGVLPSERNKGK